MKPHRGTLILIFGILGIVFCFPLGIVAWVMGGKDLKEMDAGTMDPSGRGNTNAGRICGMIGTLLAGITLLIVIVGMILAGLLVIVGDKPAKDQTFERFEAPTIVVKEPDLDGMQKPNGETVQAEQKGGPSVAMTNTQAWSNAAKGKRYEISTRNLAALPGIEELRRLCQSLAMLDAIICPEWESRFHSFNCKWGTNMMLASWRNGSGNEYYLLFCEPGAIMKGFDHESYMSPSRHGNKIWDGVLSEVPADFSSFLKDPAFDMKATTFCVWRLNKDSAWRAGKIIFPDQALLLREGYVQYDPDGSQEMMALFDRNPQSYKEFADDIYERPNGYDLKTIRAIYAQEPLTAEMVAVLNSKLTLKHLEKDLAKIGYPVSKEEVTEKK